MGVAQRKIGLVARLINANTIVSRDERDALLAPIEEIGESCCSVCRETIDEEDGYFNFPDCRGGSEVCCDCIQLDRYRGIIETIVKYGSIPGFIAEYHELLKRLTPIC